MREAQQPARTRQPAEQTMIADLYEYEIDFAALAPSAQASNTFQIQQNTSFRWTKGLYFADIAAAIQTLNSLVIPLCSVQITDQGSGQNFQSAAVPITSFFGPGGAGLPFILPVPRTFQGRSAITVTVTNFSAATTYNLRLTFAGQRLYEYGSSGAVPTT
jgi:hypothetical protein